MNNENLTVEEYKVLLAKAETENRHLSWKIRLNEATGRSFSMRDIVGTLAMITDGALFFLDGELNVSFFGGDRCLDSALAQELLKKDSLRFSEYESVLPQDDEAVTETRLENGDLCHCAHFKINLIEPFYLLLLTEKNYPQEDMDFLFETAKDCFTAVDLHRKRGDIPFGDFRTLMASILSRQITEWDEIDAYMKRLPTPPKRFVSLALIGVDANRHNTASTSMFMSKLKSFFSDCCATVYEDQIVLLISSNDKSAVQPRPIFDEQGFFALLSANEASAAFSNATQRLDMIRTLYVLTESTLRLGRAFRRNRQQRIFFFEEYADYVSFELALARYKTLMGHDDFIYLTNPYAIRIYRHDRLNGTDLQTVLFNYCRFNGNISAAAKASFMHRNTFAGKVAEIRKLIPADLDDAQFRQRMIFSCMVFKFYNLYYDKYAAQSMTERLSVTDLREQNWRSIRQEPAVED